MSVLPILTYPNPLLKSICEPVDDWSDDTEQLIGDLIDTMYAQPGCVGIAAPQAGFLKRIVIVDASRHRQPVSNHGRLVLINPVIEWQDGENIAREGCLSLPHLTANVRRARDVRIRALSPDKAEILLATSDFEARVIAHEIDHLEGLLFLDRVACLKTDVFRRKRYEVPDKKIPS